MRRPPRPVVAVAAALLLLGLALALRQLTAYEPPDRSGDLAVRLVPAFPALRFDRPVALAHAGDGSGRLFVAEKCGVIRVFRNDPTVAAATVFLDLSATTDEGHVEEGLLGLAFDPAFRRNGHLYVHRTRHAPRRGVVSRFTVEPGRPDQADPASECVILEQPQPYANHNGGCLAFGPDGMLYVGFGDGGDAGDPGNRAQDLSTCLGKILRIDVRDATPGAPYRVPAHNPFVGRGNARPEIWALGLRNPWRFAFDRVTGDCWAGDVGQGAREEIDRIVGGGNYGWRAFEGELPYDADLAASPAARAMLPPIVTYGRRHGVSVTGGSVYRGTREPALAGRYLYGDYGSGYVWALDYDRVAGRVRRNDFVCDSTIPIASFGEDEAGEVYVVGFDGRIYRVATGSD